MTDNQFNQLFDLVTKSVSGVQRLEKDVSVIKSDIVEIKSDIVEIKSDIVEMKGDIVEMKGDISVLKSDVSELKEGQKKIEKDMRLNTAAVDQMAGEQMRLNRRVLDLEKAST